MYFHTISHVGNRNFYMFSSDFPSGKSHNILCFLWFAILFEINICYTENINL